MHFLALSVGAACIAAVPSAPTDLSAIAQANSITLFWNGSAGASSYNIYRVAVYTSYGHGNPTLTYSGVTSTQFVDTGAVKSTVLEYIYDVTAVNSSGESSASNQASADPGSAPLPAPALSAAAGNVQVVLTWTSTGTSYNIFRSTTAGAEGSTPILIGLTSPTYTDTGLTTGVAYYYRVAAVSSNGEGIQSNEAAATPGATRPPSPVDLSARPSTSTIALQWAPVSVATGYNIYRSQVCAGYGSAIPVLTYGGITTTTFTDTNPGPGVCIDYYAVTATNANGESEQSAAVSAAAGGTLPPAPTGLTASGGAAPVLNWNSAPRATSYNIYRTTTAGSSIGFAYATADAGTTYTDTGATAGSTYYYNVTAANMDGEGAPSGQVSVSVAPAAPNALTGVVGLTATGTNEEVSMSWTASSGATSYNVYRGTSSGAESTTPLATDQANTYYLDTTVQNGTTYYYTVAAVNSGGTSAYSNEASATPKMFIPPPATGLTATPSGCKVVLAWMQIVENSSVSSPPTYYQIYRGIAAGGEGTTPYATIRVPSPLTYTDTSVSPYTEYYYTVVAANPGGTSNPTDEASATTIGSCEPTILSVTFANNSVKCTLTDAVTVTLSRPAGDGGDIISLVSSDPTVAQIPVTVTVPAGATTGSAVATASCKAGTVTITATYNNQSAVSPTLNVVQNYIALCEPLGGTLPGSPMTLTGQGLSEGLTLTSLVGGLEYPTVVPQDFGVDGSTISSDGMLVYADDSSGALHTIPDVDNELAASGTYLSDGFSTCGICTLGAYMYSAESLPNGSAVQIVERNADTTVRRVVWTQSIPRTQGTIALYGIATNPATHHLIVSFETILINGNITNEIVDVDPANLTGSNSTVIATPPAIFWLDGEVASADGSVVYAALDNYGIVGYPLTNIPPGGSTIPTFSLVPEGSWDASLAKPDGIALGYGSLANKLFVNDNYGNIWQIDLVNKDNAGQAAHVEVANGGTVGDLLMPCPNGSMLVAQSDGLMRLTPPAGASFCPFRGQPIYTCDDLGYTSAAPPYLDDAPFTITSPSYSGSSPTQAVFNLAGLSGNIAHAVIERTGSTSSNDEGAFDLQFGLQSTATSYVDTPANPSEYDTDGSYDDAWEANGTFVADIQSNLGGTYTANLIDVLSSGIGGYQLTDQPNSWPTEPDRMSLKVDPLYPGVQVVSGRSTDTSAPGLDQPLYGWWDVVQGGSIVASSGASNGWNVEPDQSVYNGYWVVPSTTATPGSGYMLRVASSGSADLTVRQPGSLASTPPRLLPIQISADPVVSPGYFSVTFTIDSPAPASGANIAVSADSVIALPSIVTIPSGLTSATVTVLTPYASVMPMSTCIVARYNGTRALNVVLEPAAGVNGPQGSGTNSGPLFVDGPSVGVYGALTAPTGLTAAGSGSVTLAWTAPAVTTGLIGYNILRSTSPNGPFTAVFRGLTGTSFVDTGVTPGQSYYYAVVCVNLAGPGAYSNIVSATP